MLEAALHETNTFCTLTYDPDQVPEDKSVSKKEIQNFIRRVRRNYGGRIRYFCVGEYGDRTERPHYHSIIFGLNPLHEDIFRKSWKKGFYHLGVVNKDSASYITHYATKGFNRLDKKTQKWLKGRDPEFMLCSRRPGIGSGFTEQAAKKFTKKIEEMDIEITRQVQLGKQKLPLGRFLTQKLIEHREAEDRNSKETYQYQEDFFEKYDVESKTYGLKIREEDELKRKRQEVKQNFYHGRNL